MNADDRDTAGVKANEWQTQLAELIETQTANENVAVSRETVERHRNLLMALAVLLVAGISVTSAIGFDGGELVAAALGAAIAVLIPAGLAIRLVQLGDLPHVTMESPLENARLEDRRFDGPGIGEKRGDLIARISEKLNEQASGDEAIIQRAQVQANIRAEYAQHRATVAGWYTIAGVMASIVGLIVFGVAARYEKAEDPDRLEAAMAQIAAATTSIAESRQGRAPSTTVVGQVRLYLTDAGRQALNTVLRDKGCKSLGDLAFQDDGAINALLLGAEGGRTTVIVDMRNREPVNCKTATLSVDDELGGITFP